jgi:hypothetical protein
LSTEIVKRAPLPVDKELIFKSILHSDSEFDEQSVSGDLGSDAILFLFIYVVEARQ